MQLKDKIQKLIDSKAKPLGALGQLELLALQLGLIQETHQPKIINPYIIVFAADHGIARTGFVNPYPQNLTEQMVRNCLNGKAAINIFCRQNAINLKIVDAGVNFEWESNLQHKDFIQAKVALGTKNYLETFAMTEQEASNAIEKGKEIVREIVSTGCNIIGIGEMGVGNSSSAALIMSAVLQIPLEKCVGKGMGATKVQLKIKLEILEKVYSIHRLRSVQRPLTLLSRVGGFEIAMMYGAYIEAAKNKMIVVVDGFIATSALLLALKVDPTIKDNCVFAHLSEEQGHQKMLDYLKVKPLLQLGLRLGEATGAALAIPLIQASANFLTEMAISEGFSG